MEANNKNKQMNKSKSNGNRYRSRDAIENYKYRTRKRKKASSKLLTVVILLVAIVASVFIILGIVRFVSDQMIINEEKNFSNEQMRLDIYIDFSMIGKKEPYKIRGLTRQEVYDDILNSYKWNLVIENSNPEIELFNMPDLDAVNEVDLNNYLNYENLDSKGTSQEIAIENEYKDITIRPTKSTYNFPDILNDELKSFIDDIYDKYLYDKSSKFRKKIDPASPEFECDFTFNISENNQAIDDNLDQLARLWDTKAVKGQIERFDYKKNEFEFGDDHKGYEIDKDELRRRIMQEIRKGNFDTKILTVLRITDPIGESIKSKYKYVSTYETFAIDNDIRNTNIQLACQAINGKIIKPNQEFSFNRVVGERTEEKGYGYATAYANGEVVEELGGGVCQVSTTLYNATFEAGLTTTYRRSHTFEPNYITPGLDATVSYPGVDYRFINDSEYAIGIRASFANKKVKVEIFSVPILENGRTQTLVSKKIEEFDEPPISIIESGKATKGTKGSEWQVHKVVKEGKNELEKVHDHYSRYQGHTPTAYEENTYTDKEGVIRTRAFRSGANSNANRVANNTTTANKAIPLPASNVSQVILPGENSTPR